MILFNRKTDRLSMLVNNNISTKIFFNVGQIISKFEKFLLFKMYKKWSTRIRFSDFIYMYSYYGYLSKLSSKAVAVDYTGMLICSYMTVMHSKTSKSCLIMK